MWPAVPTTTCFMPVSAPPRTDGLPAGPFALPRPGRPRPLTLRPGLAAPCAPPAFVLAERLEHVHQAEVDLPALQVHAHDLHAHAVTEPVDLAGVLAAQCVGRLQEPVVVVGHARDVHET